MASASPPRGWDDLTFMEKMDFSRKVLEWCAIGLIVLVRHKPGYRTLEATRLLFVALGITVVSYFFGLSPASHYENTPLGSLLLGVLPQPSPLPCYALAVFAIGFWKRRNRWSALKKGERWHSRSFGVSYLAYLPIWRFLPPTLLAEYRLPRLVEPAFYYCVGFFIMVLLSPALGVWLMFSAIGLFALETRVYEQAINTALDSLDGLIESEVHEENIGYFSDGSGNMLKPDAQPRRLEETAGIPTGIGLDIAAQVQRRLLRESQRRADEAQENE